MKSGLYSVGTDHAPSMNAAVMRFFRMASDACDGSSAEAVPDMAQMASPTPRARFFFKAFPIAARTR